MYEELAIRIEFFGDEIENIHTLHPLTGEVLRDEDEMYVFPASHYVAGPERMGRAIKRIEDELAERLAVLESQNKLVEAQRLRMRTTYDLEMMQQMGFCNGIENYSSHIDGRARGTAPHCLIDYFPDDFLLVIDESHVTVPQIGAMYEGDMSRKRNLVDHGFRLPSAMDNRPLKWDEFQDRVGQTVYLSATPGKYELGKADGFVQQIIRPTGLIDPEVVVKPTKGQIDDLLGEIRTRTAKNERVLVTTLTKRMAEDLTDYLLGHGVKVEYLHSDVDTLRRVELLRELRMGVFDVLVGINLLREGLDLPEVSLVEHPGRGQGRLPALVHVADPDHRPCRPQRLRPGPHVRRPHHRLDGARDRRNQPAPRDPGRLQHGKRHRPAAAAEEDRRHHGPDRQGGRGHPRTAGQLPARPAARARARRRSGRTAWRPRRPRTWWA